MYPYWCRVVLLAVLLAASFLVAGVIYGQEPLELAPGRPWEGRLEGGRGLRFLVFFSADSSWRVQVDQLGIDLVVAVEPVTGGKGVEVDSPVGRTGRETLVARPVSAGFHLLSLRPADPDSVGGRVRVVAEALNRRGEAAEVRRQGDLALSRAGEQYRLGTEAARRRASVLYQQASELFGTLEFASREDLRSRGEAASALGALARQSGQLESAADHLGRALEIWRLLDESLRVAITVNDLGLTRWEGGDRTTARAFFEQAARLNAEIGSTYGEGVARNNLCLLLLSAGQPERARPCFEEVAGLFAASGERRVEALAHNSLAGVYDELGEPQVAFEHLQRALDLVGSTGDPRAKARLLANRAALARRLGESREALADYGTAVPVLRQLGDRRWLARTLNNLGFAYLDLGDAEAALGWLEESLALRIATGDRLGEAVTRNNLGRAHRQLGSFEAAFAAHDLALTRLRELGDLPRIATTLGLLGQLYLDRGDPRQALESLSRALDHLQEGGTRRRAEILQTQGWAQVALGDLEEALQLGRRARELYSSIGDEAGEARSWVLEARIRLAKGELGSALAAIERALGWAERFRERLGGARLRSSFLDLRYDAFELEVEILVARHRAEPGGGWQYRALAAAERLKARNLLDGLESGGDAPVLEAELDRRRRALLRQLRGQADLKVKLLEGNRSQEARRIARKLEETLAALDVLDGEIAARHPGFGDLSGRLPFDLDEVMAELADATLLELVLGDEQSHLFVVTRSAVEVFPLAPRGQLESVARDAVSALRAVTSGGVDRAVVEAAAEALLGPVASSLTTERLLIVADGALWYLPFGALPGSRGRPLVEDHELVYFPSSAALLALRRRPRGASGPVSVAVFADPVFQRDDPRLDLETGDLRATGGETTGGELTRLPATRREAAAIAAAAWSAIPAGSAAGNSLAPGAADGVADSAGRVEVVTGFDANLDALRSGRWSSYRVLHFATHGMVDTRSPELSGIVLSRFDARGRPRAGFLGLRDLHDLRLESDLVVLSGCETALGKELRGEGVIGLARGFLQAGAPRVLVTLWPVDDRATADMMAIFYQKLLSGGSSPAAALRQAQQEIRSRRKWQDPFYWAGFVLIGDWRPLE